jgi:hypothetical protein
LKGAFGTLQKICEDSATELEKSPSKPLDVLIPRFIHLSDSPNPKIRIYALTCINQFFIHQAAALINNISSYIQALSKRATDTVGDVRKLVCNAFVMLLDTRPDILVPQLQDVANYIMFAMQDADENVALEASEFWLTFAEKDNLVDYLRPCLGSLIPILLKNMVYSETDLILLDDEEDDEAVPDREQDIKPRHYRAKTHAVDREKSTENNEEQDDESEDDDDDDDAFAEWNLRKCCAATLDIISNVFGGDILSTLLPLLNEFLFSDDWKRCEAGILALGAIAEGTEYSVLLQTQRQHTANYYITYTYL